MKSYSFNSVRRGAVIPMVALLLVPMLAMMAFSIDIGYVVAVRAELVNAADAAALAGVEQLYSPYQQWVTASSSSSLISINVGSIKGTISSIGASTSTSKDTISANAIALAKATVISMANANTAGGTSLKVATADVDVGYTSANGTYYSGNSGSIPSTAFPNTVKVTLRRDNTSMPNSNGEVSLFFGPAVGKSSMPLTASSTAVAYEGMITSFQTGQGNGTLIPVAVDQTLWTSIYNNGTSSPYVDSHSPSGKAWLQIYPGGTGSSMDGLLSLNGAKASSDSYYSGGTSWIQAGPTSSDIASLKSTGDLPLPTSGAGQTWAAGPGMKSTDISDFNTLVNGNVYLMPLFDPTAAGTTTSGNGTYQVTYFVPVNVVYSNGTGNNMDIAVLPALGSPITDPTAVFSNVTPLGTSTSSPQFVAPMAAKITQ